MTLSLYVDVFAMKEESHARLEQAGLSGGQITVDQLKVGAAAIKAIGPDGKPVEIDAYVADALLLAVGKESGTFKIPEFGKRIESYRTQQPKPERKDFANEVEFFKAAAAHAARTGA